MLIKPFWFQGDMRKIVAIGGGTGTFSVLRGLKDYDVDITAIVTMFDDGGSSGILRDEFGFLPPGDVRRCLVALCPEDKKGMLLRNLFNYRFKEGEGLEGHSFGNLFLTALTDLTGSEDKAIKAAEDLLHIKGHVLPVSLDNCRLCAELEDGSIIKGQTNIDIPKHDAEKKIVKVFLDPEAKIFEEAKKAIEDADLIVLGPGDLYTSVIPNLLVQGMREALQKSKAKKVYVCNLMTKFGETNNFKASDFVKTIIEYLGENVLDMVVCNEKSGGKVVLERYMKEKSYPVEMDKEEIEKLKVKLLSADLIIEPDLIRHDPAKLGKLLVEL